MAKERIDKIFSNLGLLSRSDCRKAVRNGEIAVNGALCKSPDEKADPDADVICYKNNIIDSRRFVYYMLNKPAGCITANDDPNCATVFDYIDDARTDLSAVGRLDKDTTGIILITNDGDINHRLLSPKKHVPKCYEAMLKGELSDNDINQIENGMDIGDEKLTMPAKCKVIQTAEACMMDPETQSTWCGVITKAELTICEGRFHQVKRMFEALDAPVFKLHRKSFGPLELDPELGFGEYRELSKEELEKLNDAAGR